MQAWQEAANIFQNPIIGLATGGLLSLLAGALVTVVLEWVKKPRVTISLYEDGVARQIELRGVKAGGVTVESPWIVKIKVCNARLHWFWRLFTVRQPAVDCHGTIDFLTESTAPACQKMNVRWTDSNEPISRQLDALKNLVANIYRLDKANLHREVHPGIDELIDVAIRWDNETDCYGYCDESYLYPFQKHPSWKLSKGVYNVLVTLNFSGVTMQESFILDNGGLIGDFKIHSGCRCS